MVIFPWIKWWFSIGETVRFTRSFFPGLCLLRSGGPGGIGERLRFTRPFLHRLPSRGGCGRFRWPNEPICSMYGIFTNICPRNHPNVGKYTIHGAYGEGWPKGGQIGKKTTMFPHELDIPISSDIHEMDLFEKKRGTPENHQFFFKPCSHKIDINWGSIIFRPPHVPQAWPWILIMSHGHRRSHDIQHNTMYKHNI